MFQHGELGLVCIPMQVRLFIYFVILRISFNLPLFVFSHSFQCLLKGHIKNNNSAVNELLLCVCDILYTLRM